MLPNGADQRRPKFEFSLLKRDSRSSSALLGSRLVLAIVLRMNALTSVGCVSEMTCPPPLTTTSGIVYRIGSTESRSP
jgi:hypothetical protein